MSKQLPKSALEYVLWSLVPYTEPNLKLAFAPKYFFRDLETFSRNKQRTLQNAYYRGIQDGLIDVRDKRQPRLTHAGLIRVRKFTAVLLGDNARLMVIFDIPEEQKQKRQHLRRLLRELKFDQIQKSVWVSSYDHRLAITDEVAVLNLQNCVKVYESLEIEL